MFTDCLTAVAITNRLGWLVVSGEALASVPPLPAWESQIYVTIHMVLVGDGDPNSGLQGLHSMPCTHEPYSPALSSRCSEIEQRLRNVSDSEWLTEWKQELWSYGALLCPRVKERRASPSNGA